MMKKIIKFLIPVFVFLTLVMPVLSLAATDSLVHCGITDKEILAAHPDYGKDCDFYGMMELINTVMKFILFNMVIPIGAIMFAYAGFLLITAGGEIAHARTKAKSIFINTVYGLALASAAWLIVRTLLKILGYKGDWIGF